MKHLTNKEIENISYNISNSLYEGNLKATKELIMLFDKINSCPFLNRTLDRWEDYVRMYDENFYTYTTFNALVESEKDQSDGLSEQECKEELNQTIWQLPCGWYIQYV